MCVTIVEIPVATLNNDNLRAKNPHAENGILS